MDDLKDKLKTLWKKPSSTKSGFAGQGHRLGTAEQAGVPGHKKDSRHVLKAPASSANGASSSMHSRPSEPHHAAAASSSSASRQQQHQADATTRVDPRQELRPATEFSPFTAVIGGGAALNTTKLDVTTATAGASCAAAATSPSYTPSSSSSNTAASSSRTSALPQRQQQQQQPPVALLPVSEEAVQEMQHNLVLVASQEEKAISSMQVLSKLLSNLATSPQEAKFRQIRLGPEPNPKIKANVLEVTGALDLLQSCGFEVHEDEAEGPGSSFAVFLDDAKLSLVEEGMLQLQLALSTAMPSAPTPTAAATAPFNQGQQQPSASVGRMTQQELQPSSSGPGSTSATASSAAAAAVVPPAPSIARNTKVLLPAVPDTNVPDWFFQRTPADVKAEYMSLLKRRQTGELFASRAWKEAQMGRSNSGKAGPAAVTLRVRFPEGVCLQGCFGARERVTAVFEWVTDSLRDPGLSYTLVAPNRKPLPDTGTVGDAGLADAVLYFRALTQHDRGYLVDDRGRQQPFLSDVRLAQAQAD